MIIAWRQPEVCSLFWVSWRTIIPNKFNSAGIFFGLEYALIWTSKLCNFTSFSHDGLKGNGEHRLRVFENRVLRRIFGPKRDEVTGEWRKLHNEELHNLYSSSDIIRQIKSRRMRWAGHVACMGEERKVYKVLVGMPERKRPLGRPRYRWDQNGILR
jgi:hypothetical protein